MPSGARDASSTTIRTEWTGPRTLPAIREEVLQELVQQAFELCSTLGVRDLVLWAGLSRIPSGDREGEWVSVVSDESEGIDMPMLRAVVAMTDPVWTIRKQLQRP